MKTFKDGGIHPPEMKQLSKDSKLERIELPKQLIFPVSQHIGAPAKAIVSVGDEVLKGQVIAEANGFVSVPIHASTSGKVVTIEPRTTVLGKICDHIVIESDGQDKWSEENKRSREWKDLGKDKIKSFIKDAGIVGMGGAAFPTHVKLSPPDDRPIDTLILNGIECEPYLTCDYRLMMEKTKGVI